MLEANTFFTVRENSSVYEIIRTEKKKRNHLVMFNNFASAYILQNSGYYEVEGFWR